MNTVIEVNNVSKSFGKNTSLNQVLNGACLNVQKGEFVSLMGASGSDTCGSGVGSVVTS